MPTGVHNAAGKPPPDQWRVRIRMHRQGVGDCFLLTFPTAGKRVHMLIDCGVLPGSPAAHNHLEEVAKAVRDEVTQENGKLATLVITHEHADHVSGFEPGKASAAVLESIPVDEVWMAWTENPADVVAQRLNGILQLHAIAAAIALPTLKKVAADPAAGRFAARASQSASEDIVEILANRGVPEDPAALPRISGDMGVAGSKDFAAKIATTVRAAMDNAKARVPDANFRKCLPGEVHAIPGIPKSEVRVFVLGPPHIDTLDKSPRHGPNDDIFHLAGGDLGAQARSFAMALSARAFGADNEASSRPFDASSAPDNLPESEYLKELKTRYAKDSIRKIDDDWMVSAGEFALQLDSATNNTSLALAIEFVKTGEVLLFPGDAQVENWETWRNVKWTVPNAAGQTVEVTGEDLLKRAVFYKVGHHGSHNGTLDVHGVQLMPSTGLVAMCPVVHEVTKARKGDWKKIPKESLCEALKIKCGEQGFIRMDDPAGKHAGKLDGRLQETGLWIDYYIV